MSDTLIPFWMDLKEFMAAKLVHEGKAWEGGGRWLVHEGETIDQAKSRLDDQERQRLKEQAAKEYEAEWELERQEHERLIAEEDRQETEMLKLQSIDKAVV